jgi:hypothetical protein
VLDTDSNNIEAVYHGEARRSASSVVIDFQGQPPRVDGRQEKGSIAQKV